MISVQISKYDSLLYKTSTLTFVRLLFCFRKNNVSEGEFDKKFTFFLTVRDGERYFYYQNCKTIMETYYDFK